MSLAGERSLGAPSLAGHDGMAPPAVDALASVQVPVPSRPRSIAGLVAMGALFAAAAALAFVLTGYRLYQGAQVVIYAVALLGLNLLTGYNGQISLGHGAFYAIGGYATAILMVHGGWPYWAAIPVAGIVCFGAGSLFGLPALRLGGHYLALATFALAVATPQLLKFKAFDAWTGGSQGLQIAKPEAPLGLPLSGDQWRYLFCLAVAVPLFIAIANLVRGRTGRAIVAIRDHPLAAEAMGIQVSMTKTLCFGISALYAGIAGGLATIVVGFVAPDSFGFALSLSLLVGIVVGGLASTWGVIFGALFIELVPNYADQISDLLGEGAKALPGAIYGALLVLMMALMPSGVAGRLRLLSRGEIVWLIVLTLLAAAAWQLEFVPPPVRYSLTGITVLQALGARRWAATLLARLQKHKAA